MIKVLDERETAERLRACPLFAAVPDAVLVEIGGRLRSHRFARNEMVFSQGDPGDALHIISSGSVKIVLPSAEGEEAIIATLHAGDFFGELALLDGEPRSASAIAIEATETLMLGRGAFRELLDRYESLRDALFASITGQLRRLTTHVEELHFLDLAGRLAARLARLARQSAPTQSGPISLDWPYTQTDLAAMIGGTRQSVNRLLAELIENGLVRIERDRLIVPDLDALERRGER